MGYTTNPFNYTGTLPNQVQNDLQLANDNFNILAQAFVNNDPTTGTVKKADTVDGYHASQTPMPNTIPVANASGKLDAGWLPTVSTTGTGTVRMGLVEFFSSATWTVPSDVSSILVVAVAGGGGGGGGPGGEGGYSGSSTVKAFSVSPGETITITIGAGGANGYYGGDGGTGGDTNLTGSVTGFLLWVGGGIGGKGGFLPNSSYGLPGMSSFFGRGGKGGYSEGNGEDAPRPGAGGGGGGGGDDWTSGGAGGGGFVRIMYFSS
jgi:hypothetical protein